MIKHQHQMEGINSRMDGMQAAILSAKLPHILDWTEKRIANAALYNKCLQGIKEICLPAVRPESKHTYHLYVIRAERRDELANYLGAKGIETFVHYPKILPNLPAYHYLGHTPTDFPVANRLEAEILSLPIYPELSEEMIQQVADTIKALYRK